VLRTGAGGQEYCEKKEGKQKRKERQLCCGPGCVFLLLQRRGLQRRSLGYLFARDAIASGQSLGLSLLQPQMSFLGRCEEGLM